MSCLRLEYHRAGFGSIVPRMSTGARKPDNWSRAVALQIKIERTTAGLTQTEVFKRAGIPRTSYILLESGKRPGDTVQIEKIARVFGLRTSELMARAEAQVADMERRAPQLDAMRLAGFNAKALNAALDVADRNPTPPVSPVTSAERRGGERRGGDRRRGEG